MKRQKVLKKSLNYSLAALCISVLLSALYIYFPKLPDSIDNRLRDFLFNVRGEIENTNNVIIVDIDEKSIKELGQWPWSRHKVAKILENLTEAEVSIIGFDVVFAEEDNSSPAKVLKEYNLTNQVLPNYDEILAKTIGKTPTILGYIFELGDNIHTSQIAPSIPGMILEKNKQFNSEFLINAKGTLLNIPILQNNAYSSGFFNNIPDESGIVRSVPLVISYDDTLYPSLALELMRVLTQSETIFVNYNEAGVESITLDEAQIPTDRYGRILVNFRGAERNFPYYSAIDIFNNTIEKEKLQNKIVLIGTSAAGLLDLRATPFDSVYPGVEVHANVIDNIIQGDFIYKAAWVDGANIVIIFILSFAVIFSMAFSPFWLKPIILLSSFTLALLGLYEVLFTYGIVLNILYPLIAIGLSSITIILINYFYEIKQEEAIKKKFAAKVSQSVMENLIENLDSQSFQAEEKEVTIFFSDIRGFTNISEKMNDAKGLIDYLNSYMEPMSSIINRYDGTIDKYIGDAIMAYWNAPASVENHADKAVQASLEQIEYLKTLNEQLTQQNLPLIDIGIGLNSGLAIVGEMGSIKRSDYTVIGDSINLGARLESLCKFYDSKLNISNYTKALLKEEYIFRFLDLVTVKGKEEAIEIWQVISKEEVNETLKKELEAYHQAIELYKASQFEEALKIFEQLDLNENKSNQKIYALYKQRCETYIKYPPSNFNGVYEHNTKG